MQKRYKLLHKPLITLATCVIGATTMLTGGGGIAQAQPLFDTGNDITSKFRLENDTNRAMAQLKATESVQLDVGGKIRYDGYNTTEFWVSSSQGQNFGYCGNPSKSTPSSGAYTGEVGNIYHPAGESGDIPYWEFRTIMWFSYGAPGFDYAVANGLYDPAINSGAFGDTLETDDYIAISHILLAEAYYNDGKAATHGCAHQYGMEKYLIGWTDDHGYWPDDMSVYHRMCYWQLPNGEYPRDNVPASSQVFDLVRIPTAASTQDIISFYYHPTRPVQVQKTSSGTGLLDTSGNPYYTFEGITYRMTNRDGNPEHVYNFTLDASGNSETIEVYQGTYDVVETASNDWYVKNDATMTLNVSAGDGTQVFSTSDAPKTMTMYLDKGSENTTISDNNNMYTLKDATYTVNNLRSGATGITTLTTNASGHAEAQVLYDDYSIKETKASKSFALNEDTYYVCLSDAAAAARGISSRSYMPAAGTYTATTPNDGVDKYVIKDYKFAPESPSTPNLTVPEHPQWTKYDIRKQDKQSTVNVAAGAATLKDAVYEIKYYDAESASGTPKHTWYITTDETGYATIQNIKAGTITMETYQNGRYITKTFTSDEPYRDPAGTGEVVIPCGTFTVQEVLNPVGYLFDNDTVRGPGVLRTYNVNGKPTSAEYDLKAADTLVNLEQVVRGDLDADKKGFDDQRRLPYIPFVFISETTGEWHVILTDENGCLTTDQEERPRIDDGAGIKANMLDQYIEEITIEGSDQPAYVIRDGMESALRDCAAAGNNNEYVNMFFTGYGPLNDPDGSIGAKVAVENNEMCLPYDTYRIYEVRCAGNEGLAVIEVEAEIKIHDKLVEYGTLNDAPINISTTAVDSVTSDHVGSTIQETVTVKDEVSYTNLVPGREYIMTGTLMIKTGEGKADPLIVDGKEVATKVEFIPEEADGIVEVDFTVPTSSVIGEDTVVFENLVEKAIDWIIIARHENADDEGQTVSYPGIKTQAHDLTTGEHEGAATGEIITVIDTVEYENLVPGKTYTMSGTLMNQLTGEPLLTDDGEKITSSTEFTAENADGTVDMPFEVPTHLLAGKTVVVFEDLYYDNIYIAAHADIEDESQTVWYPVIHTNATDGVNGLKEGLAAAPTIVVDEVSYENLIKGETYTMSGVLMDRATGQPLLDNGQEVRASKTFVAGEEDEAARLVIAKQKLDELVAQPISMKETTAIVDAALGTKWSDVDDKTTDDEVKALVAETADKIKAVPEDFAKAIEPLKERALAFDKIFNALTAEQQAALLEAAGLDQWLTAENALALLNAGDLYAFQNAANQYAALADMVTVDDELHTNVAKALIDELAPQSEEEQPKTDGNHCCGTVTLEFAVSKAAVEGHITVVFEDCYWGPDTNAIIVADHKDINDEAQTVYYPKLRTTATVNGAHMYEGTDEQITLVDNVVYENLQVGKEYTLSGTIWTKRTENGADDAQVDALKSMFGSKVEKTTESAPLVGADGLPVTSTITFVPESPNGSVDLPFVINVRDLANYNRIDKDGSLGLSVGPDGTTATDNETIFNGNTVVFEDLYTQVPRDGAVASELVGQHADINDEGQTVGMKIPNFKLVKTGEEPFDFIPFAGVAAAGFLVAGTYTLLRRRANK